MALPRALLAQLPPRPLPIDPARELFDRWTGMTFDPLAPGVTIANVMSDLLLDSQRSARMVAQRAIDPTLPGFADLLKQIKTRIFAVSGDKTYDFALQQLVQRS